MSEFGSLCISYCPNFLTQVNLSWYYRMLIPNAVHSKYLPDLNPSTSHPRQIRRLHNLSSAIIDICRFHPRHLVARRHRMPDIDLLWFFIPGLPRFWLGVPDCGWNMASPFDHCYQLGLGHAEERLAAGTILNRKTALMVFSAFAYGSIPKGTLSNPGSSLSDRYASIGRYEDMSAGRRAAHTLTNLSSHICPEFFVYYGALICITSASDLGGSPVTQRSIEILSATIQMTHTTSICGLTQQQCTGPHQFLSLHGCRALPQAVPLLNRSRSRRVPQLEDLCA